MSKEETPKGIQGENLWKGALAAEKEKQGWTTYLKSKEKVHPRECVAANLARFGWSCNEFV